MNARRLILTILMILGASFPSLAGETLLSFDEIQKRLDSPGFRVLDVRARADYDQGHAPGAVWVDSKAAQAIASKPGGLSNGSAWQAWFTPLGLDEKTEVAVFDGARQLDAARLWWLLSYLGVEKVALIDGNYPLWAKGKRPTSQAVPQVLPSTFKVHFQADRLATRGDVLIALKSGQSRIVDARSIEEYTGEKKSSQRGGHIPAACRLEWSDLVDKDGHFLEESALRARLSELGIKPGEPVITHCQGGGRASVDAFAIGRLGHSTRNFYQGWSDWGNATETPVVVGEKP
jgi:thiosulfate/3-mercaptopyruvate sulfurtransferase